MICAVPECGNLSRARGVCVTHYQRWRKGEIIGVEPESTRVSLAGVLCSHDGCSSPASAKRLCKTHYEQVRHRTTYKGYTEKQLQRHYERQRLRKERSVGRPRPTVCEACSASGGSLGIVYDHCHATGKGRGWLCSNCNTALGLLANSPDRIEKLKAYAQLHI